MNYPDMYEEGIEPTTLCQGDIFKNFDEEVLPNDPSWPDNAPYIVLTYSCDLARPQRLQYLTVAPVVKFEELLLKTLERYKTNNPEHESKNKNNVYSEIISYASYKSKFHFFLSPIEELDINPLFSHLSRVFSISKDYVDKIIANRIKCLKSPWREKLGFQLGYIYNRIAINDVDEIKKETIEDYVFIKNKNIVDKFITTE